MTESVMSATDYAWDADVENRTHRTILVAFAHHGGGAQLGGCLNDQAAAVAQIFHLSEKSVFRNMLQMLHEGSLVSRPGPCGWTYAVIA